MNAMPSDETAIAESVLNVHVAIADHLAKLSEQGKDFEAARNEIVRHNAEISKFERARDASRGAAEEVNHKIVSSLREFGISAKDAANLKARRNGHLEDADNFQSLIDDLVAVRKYAELKASAVALNYMGERKQALDAAVAYLETVVLQRIPAELFMLIELVAERAASGDSVLYNTDPSADQPLSFAKREVFKLLGAQVVKRNPGIGSASILPPVPGDVASFKLSPLRLAKLNAEIVQESGIQ